MGVCESGLNAVNVEGSGHLWRSSGGLLQSASQAATQSSFDSLANCTTSSSAKLAFFDRDPLRRYSLDPGHLSAAVIEALRHTVEAVEVLDVVGTRNSFFSGSK